MSTLAEEAQEAAEAAFWVSTGKTVGAAVLAAYVALLALSHTVPDLRGAALTVTMLAALCIGAGIERLTRS